MTDLFNLLTTVVPTALIAAISPTSFAVLILLLSLSKKPKSSGLGFLAGSLLIILITALLGLLAAEGSSLLINTKFNILPARINIILGCILLCLGIRIIIKKDNELDIKEEETRLKDKYSLIGFWGSALLAIGLFALNLITTILVFFASNQIAISSVNWMDKIISLLILVIITLLLVEIPLLIFFLLPQKADTILSMLNGWIQKNGHYLTASLTIIIGIYILFNGLNDTKFNLEPNYERLNSKDK